MGIIEIKEDNEIPVTILVLLWIFGIILLAFYPPMRDATGFYVILTSAVLFIYTNPIFQEYLYGIPKKAVNIFLSLLIGVGVGLGFYVLPRIIPGMSMGIPLLPQAIESKLRYAIVGIFAPLGEDFLRFAFLGLLYFLMRKEGVSQGEKWFAITSQAIFFTALHATAYAVGWYQLPTLFGAFGSIAAVSASLVTAFLFALVTGYLVTLNPIRNVLLSVAAHLTINTALFVKLSIVGLNILPFVVRGVGL